MKHIRYKIFHLALQRQYKGLVAVPLLLAMLIGLSLSGCSRKQHHIRLCESFTDTHELIGEDHVFSPGTLSLLLEVGQPIEHRIVRIKLFRISDSKRSAYGREVIYSINPSFSAIRFDDAISIADSGKYVVQISGKNDSLIAETTVDIVTQTLSR